MASSSSPPQPTLTLYSLTTSPLTHPSLPLLDPHSLYLATLLLVLCPSTTFCVRPPNLWLHKSLPRLEATGTGVVLAEGAKDVERWILNKRTGGSSSKGGEDGDGDEAHSDLALSSYLDRHVEPMVYSILFPPSTTQDDSASASSSSSTPASFERIFTRLTFPSWSSNLPFPASRTLPHSVRSNVTSSLPREWRPSTRRAHAHAQKQDRSSAAALGEEVGSASSTSGRVPLGQPSRHAFWGFGREVKEDWSEEFEKKRLARLARKVLAPVVSWLKVLRRGEVSRGMERESSRSPSAVEIRLFTLLAPLMAAGTDEVREVLRGHPIARLMLEDEEYASLRDWVKEEVERAWGTAAMAKGRGREWVGRRLGGAVAAEGAVGETEELGEQLGNEGSQEKAVPAPSTASSSSSWRSYLPSFPSFPWRKSAAADATKSASPSKPAEPPALRYGRYIWIGTAVLGTVGWLLASGVVSVSFEDGDEEEGVEVGEGKEDDDEEADGEGWQFARGDGQGEEEDEDDEDEEMVVDLDDDDDEYE